MRGMWLLALALVCAAHAQEAPPDDLLALAMSDSFAGGSAGAGEHCGARAAPGVADGLLLSAQARGGGAGGGA